MLTRLGASMRHVSVSVLPSVDTHDHDRRPPPSSSGSAPPSRVLSFVLLTIVFAVLVIASIVVVHRLTSDARRVRPRDNVMHQPLAQHRRPLPITVDAAQPRRLNIIMMGLSHSLTGGPLSIMRFAVLASRANMSVRWINIDGAGVAPADIMQHMKKYALLETFAEEIEYVHNAYACNHIDRPLLTHPDDIFMATIYHTAPAAHFTAARLNNPNIIYFIQDYEPIFFPHDSNMLEAVESYRFPHFPIYSTIFLKKHFAHVRQSIFAHNEDGAPIDRLYWTAQPAIKAHAAKGAMLVASPASSASGARASPASPSPSLPLSPSVVLSSLGLLPPLSSSGARAPVRRLITYARPNAERNAFAMLLVSLSAAVGAGVFGPPGEWQFIGIGADDLYPDQCNLGGRAEVCMTMVRNIPEPQYFALIAACDIGLSLMASPHPSLPPFDFAAAGLITVTNSFGTKDAAMFAAVSANIIVVEPFIDDIVVGLRAAVARADDKVAREKHSHLNWPTRWDDDRTYGKPCMERVKEWFGHQEKLW